MIPLFVNCGFTPESKHRTRDYAANLRVSNVVRRLRRVSMKQLRHIHKINKMRKLTLLFSCSVSISQILVACSHKHGLKSPQTPHICNYKRVQGTIRFIEHYGYALDVNGTRHHIEITNFLNREHTVYQALERPIIEDDFTSVKKKNNKIFAIGKLATCIHRNAPLEHPELACDPNEHTRPYRNFVFEGWYIKKPFHELQLIGAEDENKYRLVKRDSLKTSDFNLKWLKGKGILLTPKDLRRYVQ